MKLWLIPFIALLLVAAVHAVEITSCGEYTQSNTIYTLANDLDENSGVAVDTGSFGWNPACLFFSNAANVTLDCQGHSIVRNDEMTIVMGGDDLGSDSMMIVHNCNIVSESGTEIIELTEKTGVGQIGNYIIENNNITEPSFISSPIGTYDVAPGGVGIIRNNIITAPSAVYNLLDIEDNKEVHIYGNTFNTSGYYFQNAFATTIHFNNATTGNVYLQPDGQGYSETCADANNNGICDDTYEVQAANGGASVIDSFPLKFGWVAPPQPPEVTSGPVLPSNPLGTGGSVGGGGAAPVVSPQVLAPQAAISTAPSGSSSLGDFFTSLWDAIAFWRK